MGRTWVKGAWLNLDNRAIEKNGGLVHLAAISCPAREDLPSKAYDLAFDERAMAPTCLWCAAVRTTT